MSICYFLLMICNKNQVRLIIILSAIIFPCLVTYCEPNYMCRGYGRFLSHTHSLSNGSTKDYTFTTNSPSSLPQPDLVKPLSSAVGLTINEIATIPNDCIPIPDDYHLIDAQSIDKALTFLLEHLPPQMYLVITTREDPNLPLARLRARNQLTELLTKELRFTSAEAASFLNEMMKLNLSAGDIAALETRTEDWVAGLQMTSLAMQEQTDTSSFIQSFTGTYRFIIDYLFEEILQQQPEPIRDFLLQTAVLDRLTEPLCDAITQQANGKKMLENIERNNLFIIPLDEQRQWYRYHHLLADVLRAHLLETQPRQMPILHQRASERVEQNGAPAEAVRHALAANDLDQVANIAERSWQA